MRNLTYVTGIGVASLNVKFVSRQFIPKMVINGTVSPNSPNQELAYQTTLQEMEVGNLEHFSSLIVTLNE